MLLPEEMATVIQDNLRAVGMQTRLEVTEFVSWMDAIRSEQNELTVMSWNVAPTEPDYVFNGILTEGAFPPGFNTSYWTDEENEKLVADALNTPDPAEAKANYERAQEIVMEQAPIVPVCHRQQIFGYTNTIQNFAPMPSMALDLINVWIQG
jgi:peptide/nickel transport system substrate-binding protein